ncbi:hypothetical protein GEV33_004150 [Tenebrio molitor]|jgi:hypothetical protein|uniref:Uncharacterized protein n=1 Tax=Tenebrio molitor TaxID=7067 RepID=A0A8J6HNP3_TENMO|nr:hypothetical protein GEV33_004150 [Tenebrio molitor]
MFLYNPWDEPISRPMLRCWREFVDALETLPVLRIPRWTSLSTDTSGVELHVFCDASTRAYAAALYVRFPVSNDCFKTTLFTSKSKVSPLQTVTVPRLELCAAQLGVRLLRHVLKENRFSKCPITAWSDSQVALAWIHGHPSRWKTFVANRVSYIQTSLPSLRWKHVPSSDNSADVASHGTEPELLRDSPLWWQGPPWLSQGEGCWPKKVLQDVTSPGEEAPRHLLSNVVRIEEEPWTLLSRYSSIAKLLRVTALCVRFYRRCRSRDAPDLSRVAEIRDAKLRLIRCEQRRCYPDELSSLRNQGSVSRRSSLLKLYPVLDPAGTMLVGGRLAHSYVPFAEHHPPILPKTSPLAASGALHKKRPCCTPAPP